MNAIILALDSGDSLWPVPTGGSCLGVPLPGQSLLEWNARALGEAGVTRLIPAVREEARLAPQNILPMSVRRFPAGTGQMQALRSCAQGLTEDFLILSGALVWRGSLRPALEAHAAGGYVLTRVHPRPEPGRAAPGASGGASARGRLVPFPAKHAQAPALAVCSPALPSLLAKAESWPELYACLRRAGVLGLAALPGCCRLVDSPAALLDTAAGLLSAKCVPAGAPLRPGIWSASPLPENVELVPPCLIGAGVRLGRGSLIGPHAVLEDGARVGDHSLIQRSILQKDVQVGSRATVYGAVVCRRAALGSCVVLNEGAAVGPDARIGDNAALMEGVGVGAGDEVPPSTRLRANLPPAARAGKRETLCRLPSAPQSPQSPITVQAARPFGAGRGRF